MTQGEDMGSREAIERTQLENLERLATSRMQVAALHTALKNVREDIAIALAGGGEDAKARLRAIDEALNFGEPDGVAMFATMRSLVAAARDPERAEDVKVLAGRLEAMIGSHDAV